ncbi:hypothetical protein Tco_0818147 [Tanacetum coccineum]
MNYCEPNPCYDSNYFGFDQIEPPQFPVIHQPIREKTCAKLLAEERAANLNTQPPQETSVEILQDQENIINYVQIFLRMFNRYSFFETPKVLLLAWDRVFEIKDAIGDKHYKPEGILELFRKLHDDMQNIHEELAEYINTPNWNRPIDEHLDTIPATESDEVIKSSVEDLVPILNQFEIVFDSNYDSTSIDDDSFSIDDIDYVEASPPDSELVSLEEVKDFHPKDGEIKDEVLREKLSKINLLIAKIEALKDNPPLSSDFPQQYETIRFYWIENYGNPTSRSDYSLPDHEVFYFDDDHIEEKSSGSTTTHSDFSLSKYDSFIFDLSINPFPPADRSDFYHEEFADELAHIISPSEYDCFCFKIEPELGEFTMDVVGDIFPTREPRVHVPNVLPTHPTLNLDLDFILSSDSLFAYIVWIFLPFLTYPVTPPYLLSCGNEDTIFDPGISVYHSFMPGISHRSGTFMKFNVYPNHLNESPMEILSSTCSPMD